MNTRFISGIDDKVINTPAFIYDESEIEGLLDSTDYLKHSGACEVLFSIKALPLTSVMEQMISRLDGFSTSSLFESKLARKVMSQGHLIHLATPAIRPEEILELTELCDFISFNSLQQWEQHQQKDWKTTSPGLRINPQISFVSDNRYDPCRPYSKLGVPIEQLSTIVQYQPEKLDGIEGVHLHSNSDSNQGSQLRKTVAEISSLIAVLSPNLKWVNLGGGYLLDEMNDIDVIVETVKELGEKYDVRVILEPGAALVRTAGYIISTVLDVFQSEGKRVAILDTTVNHMPEVFEYGYSPSAIGHKDEAHEEYVLAGSTCLAGDIFGIYRFPKPITVGSRIIFTEMGAYTLPKAHTFNGVNFPSIYVLTNNRELELLKQFNYTDYASRWSNYVSN